MIKIIAVVIFVVVIFFAFYSKLNRDDSHIPLIPPRDIKPVSYQLNNGNYDFSIRNIILPISHEVTMGEFIKPYVVIENTQNPLKDYVLILTGGPWSENNFLSQKRNKKYEIWLNTAILKELKKVLETHHVIFIDDRINDLLTKTGCRSLIVDWEDLYYKRYDNIDIKCQWSKKDIINAFKAKADVNDIYRILQKENIDKIHIIGESYGARRAVNFIKYNPEKVSSFTSLYGDIFHNIDYYKEKKRILQNLDDLSLDPNYNWPFSQNPSLITRRFSNYLYRYFDELSFHQFGEYEWGYIPLDDLFPLLHDSKKLDEFLLYRGMHYLVPDSVKSCEDKRAADIYQDTYWAAFEKHICEIFHIPTKAYDITEIPLTIPVQIIYGGIDTAAAGTPDSDKIFTSENQGSVYHKDARHFEESCFPINYQEIIPEFINSGKAIDKEDRCGGWKFYDGNDLSDADLFDFNTPPP